VPEGVVYVALTIIVWGVSALRRGLWQDDVQALGEAFHRLQHPFLTLFQPDPGPLRRLTLVPSAIAWSTPFPIESLQVLSAAVWLGEALLAGWLVSLLLPGRRWTRFAVVCLTLTAASDFGTGSVVILAYNVAALLLLAAAGCALSWLTRGRIFALLASLLLLTGSLLTMEVALPAVPFLLSLFLWFGWQRDRRRTVGLLALWSAVIVPVIVIAASFVRDPHSYAAVALVPMSRRALVIRTISLWLENFAPWRWSLARPDWYVRPEAVIPTGWMIAGALFATMLFVVCAWTKRDDVTRRHDVALAALFVVMAFAANAAYAGVWFSEIHYRTHILSRIWASIAIAIIASAYPRLKWIAYAIVTTFIFFGTCGAIERQDFYLASWQNHQRELASILDAAPALRPGTAVILRGSSLRGRYLALEADYLTTHWLRMLYDDPNLRTIRLDLKRGARCRGTSGGVACRQEGGELAYDHRTRVKPFHFDALVVFDYDETSGTWRLVRSLKGDPLELGFENEATHYQPSARIVMRPWTVRQQRLLLAQKKGESVSPPPFW
jgi:hypothetical protein